MSEQMIPTVSTDAIRLSRPFIKLLTTVGGAFAGSAIHFTARKVRVDDMSSVKLAALSSFIIGAAGARVAYELGNLEVSASIAPEAIAALLVGLIGDAAIGVSLSGGLLAGLIGSQVAGKAVVPSLRVVAQVDLARYAGKWYELARLPTSFQAANTVSTAEYTLQDDGSISVRNTSYFRGKETASIDGAAASLSSRNSRLSVGFGGLLSLIPSAEEGNYWILGLSRDYSLALVGSPDRSTLFLLVRSRNATITSDAVQLLRTAEEQGFDLKGLLIANWQREEMFSCSSTLSRPPKKRYRKQNKC